MEACVYRVFRDDQINRTCGTLQGAKQVIETMEQVERYEEADGKVFAIVAGVRRYRIDLVPLR